MNLSMNSLPYVSAACDPHHAAPKPRPKTLEKLSRDFCVPHAPAALLKAVLICAGIVALPLRTASWEINVFPSTPMDIPGTRETVALEEQLKRVFGGGGIRITSRSLLPQGSGMGTSSILAGKRGAHKP